MRWPFEQRRRASVSPAGVRPRTVDGRTRASPFSYDYDYDKLWPGFSTVLATVLAIRVRVTHNRRGVGRRILAYLGHPGAANSPAILLWPCHVVTPVACAYWSRCDLSYMYAPQIEHSPNSYGVGCGTTVAPAEWKACLVRVLRIGGAVQEWC